MHPTAKITVLVLLSASAFAATAAQAATYRHTDLYNYRVVDIAGSDHLNLRSLPSTRGHVLAQIPFDQRGLAATGEEQNGWIELRFWDVRGRAITGWAYGRYLEKDRAGERTTYAVTGLSRYEGLEVRRAEGYGHRVGTLGWNATGIESRGDCTTTACPIRFYDRSGSLRGWVARDNLKVEASAPPQSVDEAAGYEAPSPSGSYWDDARQRRQERRERWRAFWRRVWTSDRHAGY
ncbi:MAG: SH3 domain-containing protein [Hyphomicrobiaceae bacterium]